MSDATGYRFLDDVAIADAAFCAWAPSLSTLFEQAARATTELMVTDLDRLARRERRDLELTDAAVDLLLFDFLQELVYYKDADRLLLVPEAVAVNRVGDDHRVTATLVGEPIDPARHPLDADIKAVTLHRLAVERMTNEWQATVVLDI